MKRHLLTTRALGLFLILSLESLDAADDTRALLADISARVAIQYLQNEPKPTPEALTKFIKSRAFTAQAAKAVEEAATIGQKLVDAGVPVSDPDFEFALAKKMGAAAPTPLSVATVAPRPESISATSAAAPARAQAATLTAELDAALREKQNAANASARSTAMAKVSSLREQLQITSARVEAAEAKDALDAATAAVKQKTPGSDELLKTAAAKKKEADEKYAKLLAGEEGPAPIFTLSGPTTFLHAGVRLLSPYKYTYTAGDPATNAPGKGEISAAAKDDTASFIEFVYANRWAWNPLLLSKHATGEFKGRSESFSNLFDFEAKISYNFNTADSDATAIVGSGDFAAEASVAPLFPYTFHLLDPNDWKRGGWSLAPEVSYGVVTDKHSFASRRRIFFGTAYTLSYNLSEASTRWLLLNMRLGIADLDSLTFVSDSSTEVEITNGKLPRYSLHRHKALEVDVMYPLSRDSHLTFGGRIYNGRRPNSWTVYAGYTKSISDVFKGLFPNFGNDEGAASGASKPHNDPAKPSQTSTPPPPSPPKI